MTDLVTTASALTVALQDERDLYRSLLELAGREERAIVGGDVEALTDITEEKEHLLELFAALETERMTAITAIAQATGQDIDTVTVTALAARLPAEARAALTSAGEDLRREALELRAANERNAELLRGSREIVDRWIQYLRAIVSGTLNYNAEGQSGASSTPRRLDRSA